jgi:hypothetical protein
MINCFRFCLNFAFKFNLRRYSMVKTRNESKSDRKWEHVNRAALGGPAPAAMAAGAYTRPHFGLT